MKRSAQELVRLCLRKDPLAWEEFVSRYANLVYWAIERSFTRYQFPYRSEDLEDVFQQVFSHLWEKGLGRAEGVGRLEGWLTIVSYRVTLDVMRKESKRMRTLSLEETASLQDQGGDPRQKTEETLFEETVENILCSLTEKESLILRLNLLEEKTHSEISELLKIPIGTISSIIQRTKEKVAVLLKEHLKEGEI